MLLKKIVGKRLDKKSKKTAFAGISSGLSVVIIFLGSLLDLIDLSTAALAGIVVLISLYKTGLKYSIAVYVSTSVISLLIVPQKASPLIYTALCGIYPFIWYFCTRLKSVVAGYLLKILIFNVLAISLVLLLKWLIAGYIDEPVLILALIIAFSNVAFLLYDYLLSVLWFYMTGVFYGVVFPFMKK